MGVATLEHAGFGDWDDWAARIGLSPRLGGAVSGNEIIVDMSSCEAGSVLDGSREEAAAFLDEMRIAFPEIDGQQQ